ncbi:chemotaxis protein CheX [Sporolituus thermophilus]|uniref:Chemotaxis phosphatase CheX n=1 Tax=Sporolituus thermophilus DSM 23256 TaxID=1123285 RepID=A0A1G7JT47_9FIRM|nr:chemotaxis protein CheX [Sporolituus thermophilus]SDF28098.1 Chemotaxis phosphatase CheX [Sporolituus thermophilus DSM 23256]
MDQLGKNIVTGWLPAVRRVLCEMAGLDITAANCLPQNDIFSSAGLAVIIGVTGKAPGRIILDMSEATARKLSAAINGEDDLDDELIMDTVAELGNILSGHIITWLNNRRAGLGLMLTPPGVFVGKDLKIVTPKLEAQIIVVDTPAGHIVLSIGFERGIEQWT